MGRTLPSITQTFLQEQQSLARFRRALRREDQQALDDLLTASRHHLAAAAYASHLLPFEIMLLAMLVEEHKQVLRLRHKLDALEAGAIHRAPGSDHRPPGNSPGRCADAARARERSETEVDPRELPLPSHDTSQQEV
jgi:hypothetical protein